MKKYLALFFAFVLVIGMLPAMAAAESGQTVTDEPIEVVESEEGTPEEGTPEEGTPEEGTPEEGTPEEGTPEEGTPEEGTPEEGTPEEGTPEEGTPEEGTPEEGTPEEGTPEEGTPEEGTPEEGTPEEGTPEEGTPEEGTPESPGLLPDSPFYFLKRLVENVKVWLTFNEDSKTNLLAELVEERAKELLALEEKFNGEGLSEKQLELLRKASDDLKLFAEGLIDRIVDLETEDMENLTLTEEQIAQIEIALTNLAEALDKVANYKEEDDDDGVEDKEPGFEKFEERISHLEQIMAKTPAAADKGLSRAIENVRRQQERWNSKHGIGQDIDNGTEDEGIEENGTDLEGGLDEGIGAVDGTSETDVEGNDNGNNGNNGNGKGNNGNGKGNSGNGKGNSGNAPGNSGNAPGRNKVIGQ